MKKLLLFTAVLSFMATLSFSVPIHAQKPMGGGTIRYVMKEGGTDQGTCTNSQLPCQTIDYAVNQAQSGDVIRVANKFVAAQYNEHVIIHKPLRLEGGWNVTPTAHALLWRRPSPCEAFRTIIDGQGTGRAITIDHVAAEVDCFTIQNGDATGLGGSGMGYDVGGGVFSDHAQLTLSNSVIKNNIASTNTVGWGGGVGVVGGRIVLSHNQVDDNVASSANNGYGGGVFVRSGSGELVGNQILNNWASSSVNGYGYGGGVAGLFGDLIMQQNFMKFNLASAYGTGLGGGVAVINEHSLSLYGDVVTGNHSSGSGVTTGHGGGIAAKELDRFTMRYAQVSHNSAPENGGGVYLEDLISAEVSFGKIQNNSATKGGGVYVFDSENALIQQSYIESNDAKWGGGVYVKDLTGSFSLDNAMVVGNTTSPAAHGAGLYLMTPSVFLRHDTFVNNDGISGVASGTGQITMKNCIIAEHDTGLLVQAPGQATLSGTMWWHNNTDYTGAVTLSAPNLHADPQFAVPGCDYHLQATSPAIDAGVNAGIRFDVDGDPRPVSAGYDIGADEYVADRTYMPLIQH